MLNLNPNDKLEGQPFIVRQICKKISQNNKEYYHLQISYGIKNYDAKIWNNNEEISKEITPGCFANVWGTVKDFKGMLQIHIDKIIKIDSPDVNLIEEITPSSDLDESNLEKEIKQIISTIKNEKLNLLLNNIFSSSQISSDFYKKAAGAEIHHAYVGGLAEHTLEVTKTIISLCKLYSYINYDIAVTSALLHDIGKVIELSTFPENKYQTAAGSLVTFI